MAKQTKITKSARGEDCTLRFWGCNENSDTVVLCHIGHNRGMGIKCSDHMAVYACSYCHDVIDGRRTMEGAGLDIEYEKLRALEETQGKLIKKGLLCLC